MKRFIKYSLLVICLLLVLFFTGYQYDSYDNNLETSETTEAIIDQTETIVETTTTETEPTIEPTETEPPEFDITLSFVGDCMLACYKDITDWNSFNSFSDTNDPSYFLEKVRHIFEADDFTIVNLENVFTDQKLTERNKSGDTVFWFKSKTSNVNILTSSSVEGVSLANNHTYDYGEEGYNDTVNTVMEAGLQYGTEDRIMYFEKEGFVVAVICSGLWSERQADSIVTLIQSAEQQSDYQVVFYHGGTEGLHQPEEWKVRASRKLVDNGADLVIGNHPHVLQPREVYNGAEIIYSLGNFCYGGHYRPENRTIIYQMSLTINKDALTVENSNSVIIPCYVYTSKYNNYQPAIIENDEERRMVLDFIDGLADSPI